MTPPWQFKMLTPAAARWLDDQVPALEELTGHPVRSRYKLPKDPDVWPPADVAVLARDVQHDQSMGHRPPSSGPYGRYAMRESGCSAP
jgi:hypothetical protein